MAFASRLAIISGGVGGLGSAIGKTLRSQGAKLALLYAPFEQTKVDETIEEAYGSRHNSDIATYRCDIADPSSVKEAFSAINADNTAFPSFLINSAGYVNLSSLVETSAEDSLKHYMVNLYGPTLTGQAFVRAYLQAKGGQLGGPGGRIVNIASQAAHVALDKHGAYCASKAGLLGLTRSQASEWGAYGITANSVSPGPAWTALGKKAWADKKVRQEYQRAIPSGNFAEPEEIADMVSYLCQESSKNINGADFRLDGGYTIR